MKKSTCVYLIRNDMWLMLLRNRKKQDVNEGKWIGVGGKNERNETFEECAVREVKEETGCMVHSLEFNGIVDFIYDTVEPEQIAVYTCRDFSGEPQECEEGTLQWIPQAEIMNLSLWEGDRIFLQRMMDGTCLPFHLMLHYDDHGTLLEEKELRG